MWLLFEFYLSTDIDNIMEIDYLKKLRALVLEEER